MENLSTENTNPTKRKKNKPTSDLKRWKSSAVSKKIKTPMSAIMVRDKIFLDSLKTGTVKFIREVRMKNLTKSRRFFLKIPQLVVSRSSTEIHRNIFSQFCYKAAPGRQPMIPPPKEHTVNRNSIRIRWRSVFLERNLIKFICCCAVPFLEHFTHFLQQTLALRK